MKIKILLLSILLVSLTVFSTNKAQAQDKFGYMSSLELLSIMPQVKKAEAQLETYAKQFDAQYATMLKEYQTKVEAFQANQGDYTPEIAEVKAKEVYDLEKRIGEFEVSSQKSLTTKKTELYMPIYDEAERVVKEVAEENGYTYIFDVSNLLYAPDGDNIMDKVKAKIGL